MVTVMDYISQANFFLSTENAYKSHAAWKQTHLKMLSMLWNTVLRRNTCDLCLIGYNM